MSIHLFILDPLTEVSTDNIYLKNHTKKSDIKNVGGQGHFT